MRKHGPAPADGVEKPLTAVLGAFEFVLLDRCGHTPWWERQARECFFAVLREQVAQN